MLPLVIGIAGSAICRAGGIAGDAVLSESIITLLTDVGLLPNSPSMTDIKDSIDGLQENVTVIAEGVSQHTAMLSSIQTSLGAIGFASTAGCLLSAVNVYQLIKVQQSLKKLDTKIEDGFADLKFFIEGQLQNLLETQQKQKLSQAYRLYLCGQEQLQTALVIKDTLNRNNSLMHCISSFNKALAVYDNPYDYQTINAPAKLRRLECCWAIQGSIAEAYYLQQEYDASLHSYEKLYQRILSETDMFSKGLDSDNHHFITEDLNWVHENDIKILSGKIKLLRTHKTKKIFHPVKIYFNAADTNKSDIKQASLPSNKYYLACLADNDKKNKIISTVKKASDFIVPEIELNNIDRFSTPKYCQYYVSMKNILSDHKLSEMIIKITQDLKIPHVKKINNAYLLDNIPQKKLELFINSFAKHKRQDENCLLLIDNSWFNSGKDGILLTDKAIYSDEYDKIDLSTIYKITLNNKKHISA
ncbi:hypothetical protein [Candidatus Venteria ishoeyi]|uniref:Uncharacterized protein n=1 Tax=Candidatus Venteria ishoeyi TaxID=1899563 RepID=A0A1H6FB88_9GAMM|nr:hypothetical protein [Candidatus Venteria ishoeyi]SEH06396.1 Uncharacterised protein [Candidatus Venteria ishoeyi]